MKLPTSPAVLAIAVLLLPLVVTADTTTTTKTETRNLRGKVVHTRTVHVHSDKADSNIRRPRENDAEASTSAEHHHRHSHDHTRYEKQKTVKVRGGAAAVEPLIDPHSAAGPPPEHHHYVKIDSLRSDGTKYPVVLDLDKWEDKLPHNAAIFTQNHHMFREEREKAGNMRGEGGARKTPSQEGVPSASPHAHLRSHQEQPHAHHRADHEIYHETPHEHHFDAHVEVERQHEHHYHHEKHQSQQNQHNKARKYHHDKEDHEDGFDWKRDRAMYALLTGLNSHFNETLFDELHDAPFRVYTEALGHELGEDESFPVFALPQWMNTTGVFTGFSKAAEPLIFENVQFLLHWDEIVQASTSPVPPALMEHIENNNFHASLIIGKSVGNGANVPFIGMVICYYQFGNPKNVLVPFSKLEDFFDDTSEKHLLDPNTKSLEMAALHDMLEEKRANNSTFYHPALAHTEERKAQLEDLEITHFQKLFQLLIRRSFLFAFGYADCLLNEPHGLRACLDDTFYNLIKMETTVRGALDDQILEQLAEINETFHSKVSEACISVQGSRTGMMYGSGSCTNRNDLGAFIGAYRSF